MSRRVVITGVGAVTPLGVGADALIDRWSAGEVGIEDGEGRCGEFEPTDFLSRKEARRADRFAQFAIVAADEALEAAGWTPELPYDPTRVGCVIGTGVGGLGSLEAQENVLRDKGAKSVSPLAVPLMMGNAAAAAVAMRRGVHGQTYGVVSACAAGNHAIGTATRMIQLGEADAVIAGGAEAAITELADAAFGAMGATSPSGISRPFDARRDGFVMGEGGGILILEDAELAEKRSAEVLGEVLGYGATSDAHHLTAPEPSGADAARAIEIALARRRTRAGRRRLRECARNLDAAQRPQRDRRPEGRARPGRAPDPGVLDEVDDRPPARRRRRRRGDRDGRGAAPRDRAADARLGGARGGARPRLRARRATHPADTERQRPPGRDLELVRVRRTQRRPVPRRGSLGVTTATVTRTPEQAPAGARGRLESLCDPDTFRPIRSGVLATGLGDRSQEGDGVVAGAGEVGGRPVFCYAQDPTFMGGSLGEAHASSIVRVMELAGTARAPVVGFVESGGARLQEGHAGLAGYGRIFRASVDLASKVPQVSVVTGVSAGGGSYSPALTDFVLMTGDARMFLTGPRVVREALGEQITMEGLGGPRVHEGNGVCQMVAPTDEEAEELVRELLGLLPQSIGESLPLADPRDPAGFDPGAPVPAESRKVYDVRDVIAATVDGGRLMEMCSRWATNMVTGFARIDGRPVAIVANQPRRLGGVIDAEASEKAAWFVNLCDRFRIPLVVMVDTPGFMPGSRQEGAGVIRQGASLLRAFAGATVPKLTLVIRKAYGGAVITMNSKDLGADVVLAWPGAEIGIMAASQAVGIVHRRRLRDASDPETLSANLAAAYAEEHLTAPAAAANGFIDEVIEPTETRASLAWALSSLEGRR